MKQVAGKLRLELAQYRELEAFAKFGSDLDKSTQAQLNRGIRVVELLKQPQYLPMSGEKEVMSLYSGTRGFLDTVPVEKVGGPSSRAGFHERKIPGCFGRNKGEARHQR